VEYCNRSQALPGPFLQRVTGARDVCRNRSEGLRLKEPKYRYIFENWHAMFESPSMCVLYVFRMWEVLVGRCFYDSSLELLMSGRNESLKAK
jgi:hypothetical protein